MCLLGRKLSAETYPVSSKGTGLTRDRICFRAAFLNMTQGQCHHDRQRQTDPYLHLRLATDIVMLKAKALINYKGLSRKRHVVA